MFVIILIVESLGILKNSVYMKLKDFDLLGRLEPL